MICQIGFRGKNSPYGFYYANKQKPHLFMSELDWTQNAYTLLCQPGHKDALFASNQSVNRRIRRIPVSRLIQKSVRILHLVDNL